MAVHRTYEGYPPRTLHWAPGDAEPGYETNVVYDHQDRIWERRKTYWARTLISIPLPRDTTGTLGLATTLPWPKLVQQHGPMSSRPRTGRVRVGGGTPASLNRTVM